MPIASSFQHGQSTLTDLANRNKLFAASVLRQIYRAVRAAAAEGLA